MNIQETNIVVGGKIYEVFTDSDSGCVIGIRSISNPEKTPYLKKDSKKYKEVIAALNEEGANHFGMRGNDADSASGLYSFPQPTLRTWF